MKHLLTALWIMACVLPVLADVNLDITTNAFDLVADRYNTLHLLWKSGNLNYATIKDDTVVNIMTIPDSSNMETKWKRPRLAVSPNGLEVHTCWNDARGYALYHAWKEGSSWRTEMVFKPGGERMISQPACAVDNEGTVHIICQRWQLGSLNCPIIYATKPKGGKWSVRTLIEDGSEFGLCVMTTDADGGIHACWNAVGFSYAFYCYAAPGQELDADAIVHLPNPTSRFKPDCGDIYVDRGGTVHIAISCYRGRNETCVNYWYKPRGKDFSAAIPVSKIWYTPDPGYTPWAAVGANTAGKVWVLWADGSPTDVSYIGISRFDPQTGQWQEERFTNSAGLDVNSKPAIAMTSSNANILWPNANETLILSKEESTDPDPGPGPDPDTSSPVRFISPADGAKVCGVVPVQIEATTSSTVRRIEFHVDGVLTGEWNAPAIAGKDPGIDTTPPRTAVSTTFQWDTTNVTAGVHTLKGTAYTVSGQRYEKTIIVAKACPPKVRITSPLSGTEVYGVTSIVAEASEESGITRVEFLIDGTAVGADNAPPYQTDWDPLNAAEGSHTLTARAFANNGLHAEDTVTVTYIAIRPPVNTSGERVVNRNLFTVEYIDVLRWEANPTNRAVAKYRIYLQEGQNRTLLGEAGVSAFTFQRRKVEKKTQVYALTAVNEAGRESTAALVTIN